VANDGQIRQDALREPTGPDGPVCVPPPAFGGALVAGPG
jgi:hypothetical protein